MVSINLEETEITEIRKTLETILVKELPQKQYFMQILIKWFKSKGISYESSQRILNPSIKIVESDENTTNLNGIHDIQYEDYFVNSDIVEQELKNLLVGIEGNDNASRILLTLKSLIPQKNLFNTVNVQSYLNSSIYGILSYDGPVVAICDVQNKQIVKGYFVRREDKKGREYHAIRIGEVLVEACPLNLVIYHDDSEIETKFEVKWISYIGKPFIVGPCSIPEMISVLKYKDLVLNQSSLEAAMISICKSFLERGIASIKHLNLATGYQISLNKWILK